MTTTAEDHTLREEFIDREIEQDPIKQIIAEFSEIFTFMRTRWFELASDIHPGLSKTLVPTLLTIERYGPVTATELIEHLRSEKTSVSKQVAQLKQFGLVDAVVSAEDRRVTLLSLTDTARQKITEVRARLAKVYRERFAGWTEGEIDALRGSLHRFNQWNSEDAELRV